MALTNNDALVIPSMRDEAGTYSSAKLLDAAGEKVAFIFRAPRAGTIDAVVFRTGSVTTSQPLRVGLETLGAGGLPSGTAYGGSSAGTISAVASSTVYEVLLGAGAAAVKGDRIAMVIQFDATAGALNIATHGSAVASKFPYTALYTTAWSKITDTPVAAFRYSDGKYSNGACALPANNLLTTFHMNDSPDEYGMRFRFTAPVRVKGFWLRGGDMASGTSFDVLLYAPDGTVMATASFAGDSTQGTATGYIEAYFDSSVALAKDAYHRIALKPLTASDCRVTRLQALNSAMLDCLDGGVDFHDTSRTDGGAWTDNAGIRPLIGLFIDQIDDGSGGGSEGGSRFNRGIN